ncbi:hypothetical protein ACSBR1_035403 [Camellia fascicularis]
MYPRHTRILIFQILPYRRIRIEFYVSIHDVEEQVIKIDKHEALNLLKASLIATTALTRVLNNLIVTKKPKQAP